MIFKMTINALVDLVSKLELLEYIIIPRNSSDIYRFHREELLIYLLVKLAHGLPHTIMAEFMFSGDSSRWG